MHSGCVSHVFCIWQKGRGIYISLAAALLRGFVLAQTRLVRILDTSRVHSGHVSRTFWKRLACIPNVCERYFGAELYYDCCVIT